MDINLINTEPLANVCNKLIDKVSDLIGWIATPHGGRKNYELAIENLIRSIEQNEKLSPLEKAAYQSKAKKILKEYINQNEIINIAIEQLSDKAEPEKLDEDWLNQFFEHARNISREDMQKVWAKALSEECNVPGSIPKSLFNIIANMDFEDAKLYETLAQFTVVLFSGAPVTIISSHHEFCQKHGLDFMALNNLEATQLVQVRTIESPHLMGNRTTFYYLNKKIVIENKSKSEIPMGDVVLIKNGQALYNLFKHEQIPEFIDYLVDYYKDKGCEITVSDV